MFHYSYSFVITTFKHFCILNFSFYLLNFYDLLYSFIHLLNLTIKFTEFFNYSKILLINKNDFIPFYLHSINWIFINSFISTFMGLFLLLYFTHLKFTSENRHLSLSSILVSTLTIFSIIIACYKEIHHLKKSTFLHTFLKTNKFILNFIHIEWTNLTKLMSMIWFILDKKKFIKLYKKNMTIKILLS